MCMCDAACACACVWHVHGHVQVHCVPAAWAEAVVELPSTVWDDSGLGGRPGSLWTVDDGSLRLLTAAQGHRPPEGGLQLRSKEFSLDAFPLPSEDAPLLEGEQP